MTLDKILQTGVRQAFTMPTFTNTFQMLIFIQKISTWLVGLKAKVKPFFRRRKTHVVLSSVGKHFKFVVTNELQNVLCKLEQIVIERQTEHKKF